MWIFWPMKKIDRLATSVSPREGLLGLVIYSYIWRYSFKKIFQPLRSKLEGTQKESLLTNRNPGNVS
jgi:hypothetical protein